MSHERLVNPGEALIRERMAALDLSHYLFKPGQMDIRRSGNLPAGVTWGCDRDLIPPKLDDALMVEIITDRSFFDAFFIFASPESKLFAYELKMARNLTLMNDRTGTQAHYDLMGWLTHVVERPDRDKGTELQTAYQEGAITAVTRTRDRGGGITLYGPDLQIFRHFSDTASFNEFSD